MSSYEYLLSDISTIKGIGTKIGKLFRKKNINTIFDLLWNLPRDFVDRSNVYPITVSYTHLTLPTILLV